MEEGIGLEVEEATLSENVAEVEEANDAEEEEDAWEEEDAVATMRD